jgi:hypothetical protein
MRPCRTCGRKTGRLSIVVTRLCWSSTELFKQEIIDHWTSNEDVLQCIIASALIPYALNGKPFVKYRGWHCLDGGERFDRIR